MLANVYEMPGLVEAQPDARYEARDKDLRGMGVDLDHTSSARSACRSEAAISISRDRLAEQREYVKRLQANVASLPPVYKAAIASLSTWGKAGVAAVPALSEAYVADIRVVLEAELACCHAKLEADNVSVFAWSKAGVAFSNANMEAYFANLCAQVDANRESKADVAFANA
eukprot:gene31527-6711_t